MIALPRELLLFPTPWHWFVHGIGLGQNRTGFDATRATRIRAIGQAVMQRYGGDFQAFVVELLDTILVACDPAAGPSRGDPGRRLGAQIAGLRDPRDHARACATAIESLVKLGQLPPDEPVLRSQLARSIEGLLALPAPTDRARYEHVHLLANLLLAAARAGWTELLQPPVFEAGERLLAPIDDLFYQGRAAGTWQTTTAVVGRHHDGHDGAILGRVLERIDLELDRRRDRPSDGAHEGRDYLAFSLFLTLGAVGAARSFKLLEHRRHWLEVATADLASLRPRSRSSQTLLFVSLLRNLGLFSDRVAYPAALVRDAAASYLAVSDGRQHDDYLRCTYLVHLARQLGCLDKLPERIGHVLANNWTQLGTPSPGRATPYGSPLMFVAYVVSALHAGEWDANHALFRVDLGSLVRGAHPRSDDGLTLPRIGFALIDAALCLRPAGDHGSELFAAFG